MWLYTGSWVIQSATIMGRGRGVSGCTAWDATVTSHHWWTVVTAAGVLGVSTTAVTRMMCPSRAPTPVALSVRNTITLFVPRLRGFSALASPVARHRWMCFSSTSRCYCFLTLQLHNLILFLYYVLFQLWIVFLFVSYPCCTKSWQGHCSWELPHPFSGWIL